MRILIFVGLVALLVAPCLAWGQVVIPGTGGDGGGGGTSTSGTGGVGEIVPGERLSGFGRFM